MSMEARLIRFVVAVSVFSSAGAVYRTPNFLVTAPSREIARNVGEAAEKYRNELAMEWLGKKLPGNWSKPCTVSVKVGQIGAGGSTTFSFDQGEVFGWKMRVQGSLERILDSVLPHEISHTILACHFRRPLPRWADEGAATLVEHESEKRRQQLMLKQVFDTPRRIPLRKLFSLTEYPSRMQSVLTLYAEGYSLVDYLVQRGDKPRFLEFLEDAHRKNWDDAVRKHYGFETVESLEKHWHNWVLAGSPELASSDETLLAATSMETDRQPRSSKVTIRGQNPERTKRVPSNVRKSDTNGRNRELVAPDPRKGQTPQRLAAREPEQFHAAEISRFVASSQKTSMQSKITAGRLRALNDGWIPVKSSRSAQVSSLKPDHSHAFASPLSEEHGNAFRNNRLADAAVRSHNRVLPLTDMRFTDKAESRSGFSVNQTTKTTPGEDRHESVPRRYERWSEFPRPRTGDSSALPGNASASAFSPR